MKRLQISLEPELDEELGRVARAEGVSKAELVRQSLRERLLPSPAVDLPVSTSRGELRTGVDLADGRALRGLMEGPRD